MSFLFIGSTGDHAGHSLLTWALARRLLEKGLRVGFMKSFGTQPVQEQGEWTDRDAFLFKQVLQLREPLDRICPYLISGESWKEKAAEKLMDQVKLHARDLLRGKDVLIVMGSKQIFFDDSAFPVPEISFASELGADVILVHRFRTFSKSIYSILSLSSLLKDRIKGIILNRVPPDQIEEVRDRMASLNRKGIPIAAVLSEDPVLSFRSIRELRETLDGELLLGEDKLEQSVGGMTVGAGDLEGDLRLFRRAQNKIVLLKPLPPEEISDEYPVPRPVAGILLTGGRRPAARLLEAAREADIALISVKDDTFASLERLEATPSHLSAWDEAKVIHFEGLLNRDRSLDRLIDSIESP